MADPCCSTSFWLLLGVAFVAAEAGVTALLVLLATGKDQR